MAEVQKLIWKHVWTDGYTYWCDDYIPFEYSSKDDFIFYVLELIKKEKSKKLSFGKISLFNITFEVVDVRSNPYLPEEDVEHNVFTLEEWFEKNKYHFI